MRADRPAVVVIGPIPPPRHGAAVVTAQVADLLGGRTGVEVVNTAAPSGSRIGYHLGRLRAHARAARVLVGLRRARPTVYITGAGGAGLWYQVALVTVARRLGLRVVHHHHSYAYLSSPAKAMSALVRAGAGSITHVVLSEEMGEALRDIYGVDDVVVCNNAVFVGEPVTAPTPGNGPVLSLGHFGNLSIEKGLSLAIATVKELVRRQVPARLTLAGPASGDQELRIIEETRAELGDLLSWQGPLERSEIDAFMETLDLLLFPSTYVNEAQPLVVLEAARLGVPAAAIDHGNLASVVPDPGLLARSAATYVSDTADLVERLVADGSLPSLRARTAAMFEELHSTSDRRLEELVGLMVGEV